MVTDQRAQIERIPYPTGRKRAMKVSKVNSKKESSSRCEVT